MRRLAGVYQRIVPHLVTIHSQRIPEQMRKASTRILHKRCASVNIMSSFVSSASLLREQIFTLLGVGISEPQPQPHIQYLPIAHTQYNTRSGN